MIKCLLSTPYIIPCCLCKHREHCEDQPIDPNDKQAIIDFINEVQDKKPQH